MKWGKCSRCIRIDLLTGATILGRLQNISPKMRSLFFCWQNFPFLSRKIKKVEKLHEITLNNFPVDVWNPAPVEGQVVYLPLFTRFISPSQVVWDFWTINSSIANIWKTNISSSPRWKKRQGLGIKRSSVQLATAGGRRQNDAFEIVNPRILTWIPKMMVWEMYSPENLHVPWKIVVGRLFSFWNCPFLGDILVFWDVIPWKYCYFEFWVSMLNLGGCRLCGKNMWNHNLSEWFRSRRIQK